MTPIQFLTNCSPLQYWESEENSVQQTSLNLSRHWHCRPPALYLLRLLSRRFYPPTSSLSSLPQPLCYKNSGFHKILEFLKIMKILASSSPIPNPLPRCVSFTSLSPNPKGYQVPRANIPLLGPNQPTSPKSALLVRAIHLILSKLILREMNKSGITL